MQKKVCRLICWATLSYSTHLVAAMDFKYTVEGIALSPTLYVVDGDTIRLKQNGRWQRIRLVGIDAPEKDQAFGKESTLQLAHCLQQASQISVQWHKKDRYGRWLAKVSVDGQDCNLAQIQSGLAWHYKQYQYDQHIQDRDIYSQAELNARQFHYGLWKSQCVVAPWSWRKKEFTQCESP